MRKPKFPMLATILLIFGIAWLLGELTIIDLNLPWLPVILVVVAIGLIVNRYR